MTLRAAHAFKVQIKVGEFLHFREGDEIPKSLLESPYAEYVKSHSTAHIIKPQLVVHPDTKRFAEDAARIAKANEPTEHIRSFPDIDRWKDNGGESAARHEVTPSAKLTSLKPEELGKAAKATPVQVKKVHKK